MKHFPWRTVLIVCFAGLAVGNSAVTLILYLIGQPNLTAWTGHVPQSTPSAVNDLILGLTVFILALNVLRNHE